MLDWNPYRTKMALNVLSQMVAHPENWGESYNQRPEEMKDLEPEQYAAKVSVRYADALIKELDNIE
jgi:hypothetical protein